VIQLEAMRRDIQRRLACASEDEVRLIDLLLLHTELGRHASCEPPLLETGQGHSQLERAYRRGWNDAMHAESPQIALWRGRAILAARVWGIEQRLTELEQGTPGGSL